ncbi:hypothetical protein [Halobacteriovorax sp. JY17]|uniref:hypothetical protein n=1 Tax=Halobacteriovorax sp. JY17 TaxID=2014617 RepID=UPI000C42D934|nr:hypothetical protein [Halobacteriovorax sp. JY17]PIK15737.1 MAG: hypothetical protein CES88_03135 [Halobacteriovorax sp. JY17]
MQQQRTYRRPKKSTVQLTSLLDLLFVMIFVSLLQQKPIAEAPKAKAPAKQEIAKTKTPILKTIPLEAQFYFYGTNSSPNIPQGKYLMQGSYDQKTGKLRLGGVGWLDRPKNYEMIPLSGVIGTSKKSFRGRIEFQTCKEFTLQRISNEGSTEISGQWKGSYICAQGATGLTLTIL